MRFFIRLLRRITGRTCEQCLLWWPFSRAGKNGMCDKDGLEKHRYHGCGNGCWYIEPISKRKAKGGK